MDVAVTHALGVAAMRGGAAAQRPGVAAAILEDHKRRLYPGIHLTPAAWELHGRPGEALLHFARASLSHLAGKERADALADCWQTFSAVLQWHNARLLLMAEAPRYARDPGDEDQHMPEADACAAT